MRAHSGAALDTERVRSGEHLSKSSQAEIAGAVCEPGTSRMAPGH